MHQRWNRVKESYYWAISFKVEAVVRSIEHLTELESDRELYEFLAADCNTPHGAELQIPLVLVLCLLDRRSAMGLKLNVP